MPDSEAPGADALEQEQETTDAQAAVGNAAPQVAFEAPEADAVEQQTSLRGEESELDRPTAPWDADEGDLAESSREVGYDDEDYR